MSFTDMETVSEAQTQMSLIEGSTNLRKEKTTMKKTLSIVLAALILLSCLPLFASAEVITLSRSNVSLIPPTPSKTDINFGETLSTVTLSGGQLWYVDPDTGAETEVKGHFEWTNSSLAPTTTGEYEGSITFYPEDTDKYNASVRLSYLLVQKAIKEGYSWPVIIIHGTKTIMTVPPSFTCDAGDDLVYYTNYTKSGGKVTDESGKDITSYGQFYIDDASINGKNRYLYEDSYITARWDDIKKMGYESAYYENVLVKVTRKSATLATAPSIPKILAGTTYADALSKLTAKVTLVGSKTTNDTSAKFWVPVYPEGCNADTPLTEDTKITVKYENPASDDTFTCEVEIDTYSTPLAIISENPTVDATALKPGMKYSSIVLNGGKALAEDTNLEVPGKFSVKTPDEFLKAGNNSVEVIFTPDDTKAYEGTSVNVRVRVTSLITTAPTLDATGLNAGDKASQIKLTGGEAKEEGTFVIANPDQVLVTGTNKIDIKFVPAADGAEYFETKTINVVVKSEFKFLDKDGNETVPVYTITYGTRLNDSNTNIDMLLAQTGCTLNATSKYTYRAPEGRNCIISKVYGGEVFPVGEHIFKVRVMNYGYTIYDDPPYIDTELQFIIKVEPVEMHVKNVHYNGASEILSVSIDNVGAAGTLDVFIDGVQVADDIETVKYGTDDFRTAKIENWKPTVTTYNKDYAVKVIYNSIENDPVSMKDYEGFFRTKLPITIINEKNISSIPDSAVDGTRVKCQIFNYQHNGDFIQWYITDLEGNELDLEIFGIDEVKLGNDSFTTEVVVDAELTDTVIYFYMPNQPIKISYKTQAMLDEEAKQEAIDNCNCICHHNNPVAKFLWKVISFFMELFGIDKPCACTYPHGTK